jgi:hypothetical protein
MLLTYEGWRTLLLIFGYADFIAALVAIGVYLRHKKNKIPKREYYNFLFLTITPLLAIQGVSILMFYIINRP